MLNKTIDAEVRIKSGPAGIATAVFSRFNVIDGDGDWTVPGAFTDGRVVPISAYGHMSWRGVLPVGKATIRTTSDVAMVEAQFLMTTQAGRDTFEVVRDLAELGQWSYGYDVILADRGPAPDGSGRQVQFLRKLLVHEVSPVLIGAGVDTMTLDAKTLRELRLIRASTLGRTVDRSSDLDTGLAAELAAIRASVLPTDHDMDREFARFVASSFSMDSDLTDLIDIRRRLAA